MDTRRFTADDENLHSTFAVATRLGVGQRRVRRMIELKVIQARVVGHVYKIKGSEVARYINALPLRGRGT